MIMLWKICCRTSHEYVDWFPVYVPLFYVLHWCYQLRHQAVISCGNIFQMWFGEYHEGRQLPKSISYRCNTNDAWNHWPGIFEKSTHSIDHQCNEKHWHKQIFQSPFPKRRGALLLLTFCSVYNMWTLNLPPVATLLGDSNAKFRGNHLIKSLEECEIKLKQHLRGYAFVWQYLMCNNMLTCLLPTIILL